MRNSKEATIKVQNEVQKVLLDTELIGQFSDGYWENSRNQSWVYLGNVEVTRNPESTGVVFEDFIPCDYKGYSVNNRTLLEYVGDRMLAKARVANYLKISDIDAVDCLLEYACAQNIIQNVEVTEEDIAGQILEWQDRSDDFWSKRAEESIKFIKNVGLDNFMKAVNSDYKMSDMRKDLSNITKVLKETKTFKKVA